MPSENFMALKNQENPQQIEGTVKYATEFGIRQLLLGRN